MTDCPSGRAILRCALTALLCLAGGASVPVAAEPVLRPVSMPDPLNGPHDSRPLCYYASSYHEGYSWSDRLGAALHEGLGKHCRIVQYDMDTKRQRDASSASAAAAEAYAQIERLDPDVIITSDDNAAKYLIVPYLVGGSRPVVFSGINWTVEEYGFPVENVTGMVEIAPLRPMIQQATEVVPDARRAAYIGAGTLTDRKNFLRISLAAQQSGLQLVPVYVSTLAEWKDALTRAQREDFVVMGNPTGIEDWDYDQAAEHARDVTRTLSLTNHDWMMPVTMLGYTKLPEEQGEWAATTALAILDGADPSAIPLVTNRRFETWLNEGLRKSSGVHLPRAVTSKAKRTD